MINRVTDRETAFNSTTNVAGLGLFVPVSGLLGLRLTDRGLRLNSL